MGAQDLTWAVGELAATATGEFDVDDLLRRLCEVAVQALSVDGVGVMKTAGPESRTRFVHASDRGLTGLERLQEALQQGPCRDAIDSGRIVSADSIAQMRWPAFENLAAEIGIQAVLAVPLISRGHTWGVLDLYWRNEHAPTEQDRASAQLLANVAVSYLTITEARDQARAAHELMAHQALHDQLTGLPNRNLIQEMLEHALGAAVRRGTLVAVLFLDVDHFKLVNDTFGHRAGDHVLQILARRMLATIRAGDSVGRISGDEFLIVCQDIPDEHESTVHLLTVLGQRIRTAIAEPITVPTTDEPVTVTASIGIGIAAAHHRSKAATVAAARLIDTADVAMYQAKTNGRDSVVIFEDAGAPELLWRN